MRNMYNFHNLAIAQWVYINTPLCPVTTYLQPKYPRPYTIITVIVLLQGAPLWRHRTGVEGRPQERNHCGQPTGEPDPGTPDTLPREGRGGEGEQGDEQGE